MVCAGGIVSGKEIASLMVAAGLRSAGYQLEFITSHWNDGQFLLRLQESGFKYQELRLGFLSASLRLDPMLMTLDQMRYWPALTIGYARLLATRAPRAVIHTNWHHSLLLLPFMKPRRDIFWAHELFPTSAHYGLVFRAIAKKVHRIVCVSEAVARSVLSVGIPKAQVAVVHSGLPSIERLCARDGQGVLRLGIAGQVGEWKGHDDLVDALALLSRDTAKILLRIFGSGTAIYIQSLKQRIEERQLGDQVEWCGFVSNPSDIFESIDVCVVPSRCEEALGMTALEASSFGRPVICTSRGGLPEVVIDGVTGFVIEAQRPEQLASAINAFVQNPALVNIMGEAARTRIRSEFSLDRCVKGFVRIIEQVNLGADAAMSRT
jgi:glycosyltransferase involved in cell wall biosynthesis